MKKTISMIARNIFSLVLVLGCVSCSNLFSRDDDDSANFVIPTEKTYIKIAVEEISGARTVLPTFGTDLLTSLQLKGKKVKNDNASESSLATASSLEELASKTIELDPGEWQFTLTATMNAGGVGSTSLKGTATKIIKKDVVNTVSFTLGLTSSQNKGGILVTVNFDDAGNNVTKVVATLKDENKTETKEEIVFTKNSSSSDTKIVATEGSGKKISLKKTNGSYGLDPGTYYLVFEFFAGSETDGWVSLNTLPTYVQIAKGFSSVAEFTVDLNEVYKITYNNDGGEVEAGGIQVLYYSPKNGMELPLLTKEDFAFLGWYTNSSCSDASRVAEENGKQVLAAGTTGDITLYAKFDTNSFYVDSSTGLDSNDGFSADSALDSINTALEKIKTANKPDYDWTIHLKGTFTGAQTIYDISETEPFPAKSLTLEGADFTTEDDMTTLNGGFTGDEKGSTLSVAAQTPVILKKLKITGGDATSTENSAGGGIYAYRGSVEAQDVLITGNRATKGGGVYVGSKATFSIKSGSIANNSAGTGSGVCVDSKSDSIPRSYGTFIMSGSAVVESDNDVYLNMGTHITIAGALSGTSPVATIYPKDYENGTEILVLGEGAGTTIEDECSKFAIIPEHITEGTERDIEGQITKDGELLMNVDSEGVTSQITSMTESGSVEISGYVANGDNFIASLYSALLTLKTSSPSTKVTELDMRGVVGLTELKNYAFWTNGTSNFVTNLESIILPDSVTSIGSSAFRGSGLTTIYIPANLTSINPDAFYACSSLSSITASEECKNFKVVDNVLYSKDGTKLVMYGDKTTESDFTVPAAVTEIGTYAFCQAKITALSFASDSTLETIGNGAFTDCYGFTNLEIPDSVTTIAGYAFYGCRTLTSLKLPNGTTTLPYCSFSECSRLESVIIPVGVTTIGEAYGGAFSGCSVLTTVYYTGSESDKDTMTIRDSVINGAGWTYLHKSAPDTVGDIVFNDGTAMTYISGLTLTEEQKEAAVAVIFYAGNTSDMLGEKLLGVGLHESESLVWAKSGTQGYSTQITSIAIKESSSKFETVNSADSWTFTSGSDLDGSNNWEEICTIDTTASENAAENYPAFDWVNKYAASYSIPADSEKNWYMPTMAEHSMLYREKTTVNAAISLAGGNALTGQYWSSNQYNETSSGNGPTSAWNMSFGSGRGYWSNSNKGKAGSLKTIAIRQF